MAPRRLGLGARHLVRHLNDLIIIHHLNLALQLLALARHNLLRLQYLEGHRHSCRPPSLRGLEHDGRRRLFGHLLQQARAH